MLKRIVFLASGILAANAFGMAQDHITPVEASATSRTVARCRIEEFGVHNALRDIAERAHVVIGLEAVQPEKEETIVLDFPGGTTADLLNLFISQSPDYKWEEVDGGIIRVRRNGGVSLANVSMSYPAMLHQTREEIWESIVRRPEIVAWIDSSHCTREELFSGKEFRNHNDRISIPSGVFTLAQLLDEVAVKSGVDYWAVLQSPPDRSCHVRIILW